MVFCKALARTGLSIPQQRPCPWQAPVSPTALLYAETHEALPCVCIVRRSRTGSAPMSSDKKLNVFVSYSHEDKPWLERVQVHLKPLAREGQAGALGRHPNQGRRAVAQGDQGCARTGRCRGPTNQRRLLRLGLHRQQRAAAAPRGGAERARSGRPGRPHQLLRLRRTTSSCPKYQTVNPPDRPIEGAPSAATSGSRYSRLSRGASGSWYRLGRAAPEIPLEYLEWLRRRCAGVELLGQDVQQSLAIELRHVYVPALTQREAATAAPEEPTRRGPHGPGRAATGAAAEADR